MDPSLKSDKIIPKSSIKNKDLAVHRKHKKILIISSISFSLLVFFLVVLLVSFKNNIISNAEKVFLKSEVYKDLNRKILLQHNYSADKLFHLSSFDSSNILIKVFNTSSETIRVKCLTSNNKLENLDKKKILREVWDCSNEEKIFTPNQTGIYKIEFPKNSSIVFCSAVNNKIPVLNTLDSPILAKVNSSPITLFKRIEKENLGLINIQENNKNKSIKVEILRQRNVSFRCFQKIISGNKSYEVLHIYNILDSKKYEALNEIPFQINKKDKEIFFKGENKEEKKVMALENKLNFSSFYLQLPNDNIRSFVKCYLFTGYHEYKEQNLKPEEIIKEKYFGSEEKNKKEISLLEIYWKNSKYLYKNYNDQINKKYLDIEEFIEYSKKINLLKVCSYFLSDVKNNIGLFLGTEYEKEKAINWENSLLNPNNYDSFFFKKRSLDVLLKLFDIIINRFDNFHSSLKMKTFLKIKSMIQSLIEVNKKFIDSMKEEGEYAKNLKVLDSFEAEISKY